MTVEVRNRIVLRRLPVLLFFVSAVAVAQSPDAGSIVPPGAPVEAPDIGSVSPPAPPAPSGEPGSSNAPGTSAAPSPAVTSTPAPVGPAAPVPSAAAVSAVEPADAGVKLPELFPPLEPDWAPVAIPAILFAPGAGQLLRGDKQLGGKMTWAAGGIAAAVSGAALFIASTGASDVSAAIGVPVLLLGAGGYSSLVAADLIAAFSDETDPLPASLKRDVWSAPVRAQVAMTWAPRDKLTEGPEFRALASYRGELFLLEGQAGIISGFNDGWAQGGGGVRVLGYSAREARAGLWLEGSVRHDWAHALGYDSTRVRLRAVSQLPMGLLHPRFGRVYSQIALGLDPTWWRPKVNGAKGSFELPLNGGFDLRWDMFDWLRIFTGYEHARDELSGAIYVGFLGTFYAGAEVTLTPLTKTLGADIVWGNRIAAGNPASWTTYIEVRP